MKHIKTFESNNSFVVLIMEGYSYDEDGSPEWIYEEELFYNEKDLENYLINYINNIYENFRNSEEIDDEMKQSYKDKYLLDNFKSCEDFFYDIGEYNLDNDDSNVNIYKKVMIPLSNINIEENVKKKIEHRKVYFDAKKYNI